MDFDARPIRPTPASADWLMIRRRLVQLLRPTSRRSVVPYVLNALATDAWPDVSVYPPRSIVLPGDAPESGLLSDTILALRDFHGWPDDEIARWLRALVDAPVGSPSERG